MSAADPTPADHSPPAQDTPDPDSLPIDPADVPQKPADRDRVAETEPVEKDLSAP
jgi:hypothetical protein